MGRSGHALRILGPFCLLACSHRAATPKPMPIDKTKLYPIIVPTGYLPSASPGPFRKILLDGLEVALVLDHPGEPNDFVTVGLAQYVRDVDLAAADLTPEEAYRIAIDNLAAAAEKGLIRASAAVGSDGNVKLVIWADHWLAATCLLLPGLHKMASAALGTDDIIATIPHRDVLILFADKGTDYRADTARMIREKEQDGRKPITDRLLRLLPSTTKPFYEEAVVTYVE